MNQKEKLLKKFEWLIDMDYSIAKSMILLYSPYFLYPYYIDGKNHLNINEIIENRIQVRIENNIIVDINDFS